MMNFLAENGANIIIGLMVLAVIVFAAYSTYKTSKTSPCGGSCSGCGKTSSCRREAYKQVIK